MKLPHHVKLPHLETMCHRGRKKGPRRAAEGKSPGSTEDCRLFTSDHLIHFVQGTKLSDAAHRHHAVKIGLEDTASPTQRTSYIS